MELYFALTLLISLIATLSLKLILVLFLEENRIYLSVWLIN